MNENSNSDVIHKLNSLYKEKETNVFKVPITSVTGEYFYNQKVAKFELEEISFNGLYMKVPQIIPLGEEIDMRFSLSQGGTLFWAKGKITRINENRVFVQFAEIPPQTIKTIEEFMEILAEKNARKLLEKNNTPQKTGNQKLGR